MKQKKRVTKTGKTGRRGDRLSTAGALRKGGHKKSLSLTASAESSKSSVSMSDVMEFYKPIKKPVTLRLDADVLAWFQRAGSGYQTRINRALRKLMMEERNQ
jgi:uncharacterized protein (DUF4415 family)